LTPVNHFPYMRHIICTKIFQKTCLNQLRYEWYRSYYCIFVLRSEEMDHFDWSIFESGPLWAMDRIPSSRNQFQILKLMVLYLWKCSFNHLSQLTPNSLPITPRGATISYPTETISKKHSQICFINKRHTYIKCILFVSPNLLKLSIEIYISALGNLPLNISLNRTVVIRRDYSDKACGHYISVDDP